MSKKLYFLISFVLVLSLAGNALAYDIMMWDNDRGKGDRLWDNALNWKFAGPSGKVPTPGAWVALDKYADVCDGPIINSDMNAVCMWLDYGYYASGVEVVLTMEGGTLAVGNYFGMGYYNGGYFSFDISGGIATIPNMLIGYDMYLDPPSDYGYNTLNMSGGVLNTLGYISIGTGRTYQADMNMTGGDVNIAGGWLEIGSYSKEGLLPDGSVVVTTGKGHVDLHGGTIEASYLSMGGGGVGTMDFAGGTLILDGDFRVPNGWLFDPCSDDPNYEGNHSGTIAILAKRGIITSYGVEVGDIITDDVNHPNEVGLRATINLDYDVTNLGQTTITAGAVDPNLAFDPYPLNFSGDYLKEDVNLMSWVAGPEANEHDVYFGASFAEANDANTFSDPNIYLGRQALADVNSPPGLGSFNWDETYYWRIDEVNASGVPEWKGTVWSFAIRPACARNPSPTGTSVSSFSTLTWGAGPVVADVCGHYFYFSTDFNDVNDRDPNLLEILDTNSYVPPQLLELARQYYWAVDEFNNLETPKTWLSPVWTFTTSSYLFVDNMEKYVIDEDMREASGGPWNDYWSDPEGDLRAEVFVEKDTDLVHSGTISMEFSYCNDKVQVPADNRGYSEAWAYVSDLWARTDWTAAGAKALVLYFRGEATNPKPQPLYLVLSDGTNEGMVTYDDANGVQEEYWHTWNIDLGDPCFTAVDMNIVEKIWLGVGVRGLIVTQQTSGGEGYVYFDDIRLHPPRCLSALVETDITGDCVTNYADVNIMARDWLMYDYNVPAVAISGDPCGWWQLDEGKYETAVDISGRGNDGTIFPSEVNPWVDGHPDDPNNSALHFDGDGIAYYDRVECAVRTGDGNKPGDYPAELMPDTFTVACWAKIDSFDYFEGLVGNGTDYGMDERGFYLYSSGHSGNETFGLGICTMEARYFVETPNIYKIDTWYHLAATYNDANMVNIYVDGAQVPIGLAEGAVTPYPPKLLDPIDVGGPMRWTSWPSVGSKYPECFVIGAYPFGFQATWKYAQATIDEVRLYGYALSYGEIVTLAEQEPARYIELVSPANLYDDEPEISKKVNFRDYLILADHWLEGPILWPPE